jgi:serine/threonine protein kinase
MTNESGYHVTSFHLLFPLADTDLTRWMTTHRTPFNIESFPTQERQKYLYRSIYGLVSGVSYLHRGVNGRVITHHDLKPDNILVVGDTLKIADFGHSHLRPILDGSSTEGAAGLGTYEYQPPEYYKQDGSRANFKYGRAFDVWAMGCIVIELATLIVHGWQSGMVNKFREERKNNPKRERKTPKKEDKNCDKSFHNNLIIVKDWVNRLDHLGDNKQLKGVLRIARTMLAPEPRDRLCMWEIQMDLHEALKYYDEDIPHHEEDPCLPPPLGRVKTIVFFGRTAPPMSFLGQGGLKWYMETPLHRAARTNNRTRAIRLWELGWPLSLPDPNGETPLDIMRKSDSIGLQKLEEGVISMIDAARIGNTAAIRNLFRIGLSSLMVNADGRSALFEAIKHSRINVIDCLLESKGKEQLMLWDRVEGLLPLHKAAQTGSVEALERLLKHDPNVNIHAERDIDEHRHTALYYAVKGSHLDAVRLLIKNKALLMPQKGREYSSWTPLHAALSGSNESKVYELLKLLLEADDYRECIDMRVVLHGTPLTLAATMGHTGCCDILFKAGASVHGSPAEMENFLSAIAEHGRLDILQQYIHHFTLEDFEICNNLQETPLKQAQKMGHKEVARLLKSRIAQLSKPGRNETGPSAFFKKLKDYPFMCR